MKPTPRMSNSRRSDSGSVAQRRIEGARAQQEAGVHHGAALQLEPEALARQRGATTCAIDRSASMRVPSGETMRAVVEAALAAQDAGVSAVRRRRPASSRGPGAGGEQRLEQGFVDARCSSRSRPARAASGR